MRIFRSFLAWFIPVLLVSCAGPQIPAEQSTKNPSTATPLRLPTLPNFPTPTLSPTETLSPTATATPSIPFTLNRLRMVFVKDGSLYLQEGMKPIQLTYSGKDREPIISNDGEKIVFYRGEAFDNVYSINADGSQEQTIIVSQSLSVLGRGDIKSLTFVPNTHFLLFNTYLCNQSINLYNAPDCTVGIYSVDADSGEISELVSGLSGNGTQTRNFEISPDGNYVSVATSGHIDIYALSMQRMDISQQNAILYNRTTPDEFLPLQYWLPDSSGLVVLVAADIHNEPATPPHSFTVWRYTIHNKADNSIAKQILLDPPIMYNAACNFSVSPDRNQIFYITDRIPSLYLGNLNDGRTQPYEWESSCPTPSYYSYPQWSQDSQHFAWQGTIATINGAFISIAGDFSGWIDVNHYFYVAIEENKRKTYIGKIGGDNIALPEGFQLSPAYVLLDK